MTNCEEMRNSFLYTYIMFLRKIIPITMTLKLQLRGLHLVKYLHVSYDLRVNNNCPCLCPLHIPFSITNACDQM